MWAEWHRRRMLKRLADKELIKGLMPDSSVKRRWTKFLFLMLILTLTILMLARPQMGTKVSHEKRNGIEAIICLDISNSMLAEDVTPNRLMKSKMLIENMVDHFSKDKIGLIVFAGDAFVQLPITSDYVSAKMFMNNVSPSLIRTQGTDIAGAINLATKSFTQQGLRAWHRNNYRRTNTATGWGIYDRQYRQYRYDSPQRTDVSRHSICQRWRIYSC